MQYAAICFIVFVFLAICSEIGNSKDEIDAKILRQTPSPYIADVPHGDLMLHFWTIVFLISIITSASNTVSEIQYMSSDEAVAVIEYAQSEAAGVTAFATLCLYISYFLVAIQYKFMYRIATVARLYRGKNYAHSAYPREFASLFLTAYSIGALSQFFDLLFCISFYEGIGFTDTLTQEISKNIGVIIAIMFWGIVFHLYWKNIDKRFKNIQQMDLKRTVSGNNTTKEENEEIEDIPKRIPPHIEDITKDTPQIIEVKKDTLAIDKTRLTEIQTALQKIPASKVKQWYADGKITEEQYRSIARKYNSLRKEMKEIQERIELLQEIDE